MTVEANPETVDRALPARAARAPASRAISLGMQSAAAHVLAALDRTPHAGRARSRRRGAAREAGFEHVSLDLIYGTPGERDADWEASLDGGARAPASTTSAPTR